MLVTRRPSRPLYKSVDGVSLIDLANVQALVADYRARAAWAALAGGMLIVLILAVQLRNLRATARIAASVAVSMAITAAVLILIEGGLTLFHLVALLLAAGIGTNYALFIGMPRDPRDKPTADALPVTLSVMLAAGTTLIAFATLAMSSTPVLHMIGVTVAIGATVALVVSMALAPERSSASITYMKFNPVAISAYTATTAVGRRARCIAGRVAQAAQRIEAVRSAARFCDRRRGADARHVDRRSRRFAIGYVARTAVEV